MVAHTIVSGFSYLPSYPRSPCGSCWIFLKLTLVCAILQLICFCWHLYLYHDVRGNRNTSSPSFQGVSCHLDAHIQNIFGYKDTICLFLRLFYRTISPCTLISLQKQTMIHQNSILLTYDFVTSLLYSSFQYRRHRGLGQQDVGHASVATGRGVLSLSPYLYLAY